MPAPHPIRVFVVIVLSVATAAVAMATYDYMLAPMQADLGFSLDAGNLAVMLPALGGLAVVFVAGALGDHVGQRRVIALGAATFVVGAVLVAGAPNLATVAAGRTIEGVGGLTTGIVATALLADTYVVPRERAIAFGAGAAILPGTFMLAPPIGAALADVGDWRLVAVLWAVVGVATAAAALTLLPADPPPRRPEVATPLLAGIVLVGVSGAAGALASGAVGWALMALAGGAIAAVALVVALRRVRTPGLDLRIGRTRTGALVLLAILLAESISLLFFTTLFLQAQYDVGVLAVALMMVPAGVAGVAGGVLGGMLMRRVGPQRAALLMLLGAALAPLPILTFGEWTTAWVTLAVAGAYALFQAGAVGPLVARLMNLAPPGGEGAAAAQRRAAGAVGIALGTVVAGILVFSAFQSHLTDSLMARGLPPERAQAVAAESRARGVAEHVSGGVEVPRPAVVALGRSAAGVTDAPQRTAFGMAALVCSGSYLLAMLALWASGSPRRRNRTDGSASADAPT